MALLTAEQVLRWVPSATANPALLAEAIADAESMAAAFCDRILESAAQDEYHDVIGIETETLCLRAYPVTTLTSVRTQASATTPRTCASTEYLLEPTLGHLYRVGGAWPQGRREVRVVYVGGYTRVTMPGGLRRALCQLVAWVLQGRGNVGVANESSDGVNLTYRDMMGGVPRDVAALLMPYRRAGVG